MTKAALAAVLRNNCSAKQRLPALLPLICRRFPRIAFVFIGRESAASHRTCIKQHESDSNVALSQNLDGSTGMAGQEGYELPGRIR
jgi:hypothetical protein